MRSLGTFELNLLWLSEFGVGRVRLRLLSYGRHVGRLIGPHQKVIAFRQDGRIDAGVAYDERGAGRKSFRYLLTDVVGYFDPVERPCRIPSL